MTRTSLLRHNRSLWKRLQQSIRVDSSLLTGVLILVILGLVILYSAANQHINVLIRQLIRIGFACIVMIILAQIPPEKIRAWAPWVFAVSIVLLLAVLVAGEIDKGAQRWLSLGFIRFQPSELMKLALPVMLAWYLADKRLPPSTFHLIVSGLIIIVPVILTAKQPDLGTAVLIAGAGAGVLLLAGISWRLVLLALLIIAFCIPVIWHMMHGYQRERVLTFFDPERDPLGAGYHIIQSKIAIGSGGIFGKGWLNGTQSHLHFLPEHATDFIFAVCSEEFGLIGTSILIVLYTFLVLRGLYISLQAQDSFSRLLAGSLSLILFMSFFVNMGMVSGILPVVGLPLPLISYGGTSVVTFMGSFGLLMSIHNHRRLVPT